MLLKQTKIYFKHNVLVKTHAIFCIRDVAKVLLKSNCNKLLFSNFLEVHTPRCIVFIILDLDLHFLASILRRLLSYFLKKLFFFFF